jgi:hypothetical protein
MIGRLSESWIAPGQPLDLRARVRLRHTLVDERDEWQQRPVADVSPRGRARSLLVLNAPRRKL